MRSLAAVSAAAALALQASAATYTVNSQTDNLDFNLADGVCDTGFTVGGAPECTLRAAIDQANNFFVGTDTIAFWSGLVPDGSGSITFTPTTAYSSIVDDVIIDGYTAPTYDAGDPWALPVVNIDGSLLPAEPYALRIVPAGGGSTIRGIGIVNWNGDGLRYGFSGFPAINQTIQGCHIGVFRGAAAGNGGFGIRFDIDPTWAVGNTIGQVCDSVNGCTGKGNVISGNGDHGLVLGGNDNVVAGNRIGTSVDGTTAMGNIGYGILTGAGSNNTIGSVVSVGGADESSGNLVSGNFRDGIFVVGSGSSIRANSIGTNAAGTGAIPNFGDGIVIFDGTHTIGSVGEGSNLISGNASTGISVGVFGSSTDSNAVVGNRIGVNAAGTSSVPNGADGIQVMAGDSTTISDNLIGGNGDDGIEIRSDSNLIADNLVGTNSSGADLGNVANGVHLVDAHQNDILRISSGNVIGFNANGVSLTGFTSGTEIVGNYVGTNEVGANLGNDTDGIQVDASTNTIGADGGLFGTSANTIAWNGRYGVMIDGAENSVLGNFIGTNAIGAALGNGSHGVYIHSIDNVVGALSSTPAFDIPDRANEISFNTGAGVYVLGGGSLENPIRGNSIHDNGGLGIDLVPIGVNGNDADDVDFGPNNRQNSPVIVPGTVVYDSMTGVLELRYSVDSLASFSTYPLEVDFYLADAATQEGEVWMGADTYSTPQGLQMASFVPVVGNPVGGHLIATASDSSSGVGNTSEFSSAEPVPEPGQWALGVGIVAVWGMDRRRARTRRQRASA